MYKDKRDVVKEYQEYCRRCCLVESVSTASYWCETYLRRDTKINQQRIAQIYEYIESKENKINTEDLAMERKYYEVEFAHKEFDTSKDEADTYSICIIAEHYPSIEEATEFCKNDMKNLGYSVVISVTPISYDEAHKFFDMENEDGFPVLK